MCLWFDGGGWEVGGAEPGEDLLDPVTKELLLALLVCQRDLRSSLHSIFKEERLV